MRTYLAKNPWFLGLIAALVFVIIAFGVKEGFSLIRSETASSNQIVNIVGKVQPADMVDLSFDTPGRVVKVTKTIGDRVASGEVILEIDNSALEATLRSARATVQYQKAKLAELQSGTSTKQVAIIESQIANDQNDVDADNADLLSIFTQDASTTDDAIHNKVDEFFINPLSSNPQLAFSVTAAPETSIQSGRVEVESRLQDLDQLAENATTTADLAGVSDSIENDLAEIKLFLDNTSLAVNALVANGYLSNATITRWVDDLASARENVDDSITATLAADENLKSVNSTLTLDQHELDVEKTTNLADEIATQQAEVVQAEAQVNSISAEIETTYLHSPISGIVTRQDARLDQTIPANVTIVSIVSDSKFQIAADVSEGDVGKLKVGDQANVTLDSYGPAVIFPAVIVSIDDTATSETDPPSYRTIFQFQSTDDRIRSGMTAHIVIGG